MAKSIVTPDLRLALLIAALSDPEPLSLVLMTVYGLAMNVDAENADVPLFGSVTVAIRTSPKIKAESGTVIRVGVARAVAEHLRLADLERSPRRRDQIDFQRLECRSRVILIRQERQGVVTRDGRGSTKMGAP